jgi:nitrite reductase (NADH) large subunit
MDHVKKKILDDEAQRKALWARLQHALEGEPDPWFELSKAQVDTRQFQPIATA